MLGEYLLSLLQFFFSNHDRRASVAFRRTEVGIEAAERGREAEEIQKRNKEKKLERTRKPDSENLGQSLSHCCKAAPFCAARSAPPRNDGRQHRATGRAAPKEGTKREELSGPAGYC